MIRRITLVALFFLVFGVGVVSRASIAEAAVGDGVTTNIVLLDPDTDGYPDSIQFNVGNPNGETWTLAGSAPYGISVTQNGLPITVDSVSIIGSATANPLSIAVELNQESPPLKQSTDGVGNNPIELIYTRVGGGAGCTNCIRDTVDEEMNAIATGDTSTVDTENDQMSPILLYAYFNTATTGGYDYNAVDFAFSEPINIALDGGGYDLESELGGSGMSTATFGAMTSARDISGLGYWGSTNGGDYVGSSATANQVIVYYASDQGHLSIVFNTEAESYFSAGTTAPTTPTFTTTTNSPVIGDNAGRGLVAMEVGMYVNSAWDVIKPTISSTYSCDPDGDGDINRVQVTFSETVNTTSLATSTFEFDNDDTNNGTGEETPASWSTETQGCDGNANDADAVDEKVSFDLSSGISGTNPAYLHYTGTGVAFVKDGPGNVLASGSALGTEFDRAAPRVIASTPSSGGTGLRTAGIALTFSEPMDATEGAFTYTLSGSPALSRVWSSGNSVVTLSGNTIAGRNTLAITAAPDANAQAFGSILATGTTSLTFTALGESSDSSAVARTYDIDLLAPLSDTVFSVGDVVPIVWTTDGGTGAVAAVTISYAVNGAGDYTTIVTHAENDGAYDWTPLGLFGDVVLRIQGTDLATALASDTVTIRYGSRDADLDDENGAYVPMFIKGASSSTVYYVSEDGHRLPFLNEQIFATYADDFSGVVDVSDDVLSTYPLGAPLGPNPGTVLVKVQSVSKVFAGEGTAEHPVLRWISSETLAAELYGTSWADYVIDIPPTMWPHLDFGDSVDEISDIAVDPSLLLRREALGF